MPLLSSSGDSYEITIKSTGDTKGIKDTQEALGKLSGQSDHSGTSFLKLSGAVAAGQAAFALASEAIHKTVDFLAGSVKDYQEVEHANAALEHAVIGVSHATKDQLTQTSALADALSKKGVLDDDALRLGLAQLSTFGLSNKAVQALGGSLSDLAVNQFGVHASGEQLADTANMIAKALNGQFGVLEKSGIRFSAAQKQLIQYGTEQQKVTAINEGFAQNLKFTNDVALTTTEGKLAHLSVMYGNVKESIGKVIVDGLVPFISKASAALSSINWDQIIQKTVAALKTFWAHLVQLYNTIIQLAQFLWGIFGPSLTALWNTISTQLVPALERFWNMAGPVLMPVLKVLAVIIGVTVYAALWLIINALNVAIQAFSLFAGWISNVIGWLRSFAGWVGSVFYSLGGLIYSAVSGVRNIILGPFQSALDWIKGLPSAIANALSSIPGIIENKITGAAKSALNKLKGVIPGFASGVTNFGGGFAVVGEQGPELVNLPRGSDVIPARKTEQMLSNITNNKSVSIGTVVLNSDTASNSFFKSIDKDQLLVSKGLTPRMGM
jgi:hypothetical protein